LIDEIPLKDEGKHLSLTARRNLGSLHSVEKKWTLRKDPLF
jgi:hypothetical protein